MTNLLRVSKINPKKGPRNFPLERSTVYKWAHCRKYPEIFTRIGGALFVNLDKFYAMAESGKLN
jgi:hypothetical protein